jgi:competence protein ComEC
MRYRQNRRISAFLLLLALALIPIGAEGRNEGKLNIIVHDVGHGDMIEIITPGGLISLIDCGSASSPKARQAAATPSRRLRYFIASHAHEDHIGNAPVAAANAETIVDNGFEDAGFVQAELYSLAARGKKFLIAEEGMRLDLGGNVFLDILAPAKTFIRGSQSDANNNSLILMLTYGRFRMLFTGDIENEGIEELLMRKPDLECAVVKIPHHGSRGSQNARFIRSLRAKYAIVSASADGAQGHGLPHEDTLRAYREAGAEVYVTGRHGTIRIISNGEEYEVRSERSKG